MTGKRLWHLPDPMSAGKEVLLVTGGTGFIGRRLCQRLKAEGETVVAMGRTAMQGPWDDFLEKDLSRDPVHPGELKGVSTLYHLAGMAPAAAEAGADRSLIVEGTRRLVQAARQAGVPRFLYLSSVKVMGEGNPVGLPLAAMDERWPHTPQSPFGMAMAEAEQVVRQAGFTHAVVLRSVMVFGPGEKGHLAKLGQAVRRGRFPPLPEFGNKLSTIHVDDLIEFIFRATLRPLAAGQTYILTGPTEVSTRELVEAIRASLEMPPGQLRVPLILLKAAGTVGSLLAGLTGRRLSFDRETLGKLTASAWYSSAKARRELDYQPLIPVTEWLRRQAE